MFDLDPQRHWPRDTIALVLQKAHESAEDERENQHRIEIASVTLFRYYLEHQNDE